MTELDLFDQLVANELPSTVSEVFEILNNPEFDKAGTIHDWRSYVPVLIIDEWDNISSMTRLVAYIMAYNQAKEEDWE